MMYSICNELFGETSLDMVFQEAKRLGYDALEIAPFTISGDVTSISSENRRQIIDLANKHDIGIVGTHWILLSKREFHFFNKNGICNHDTIDYIKKVIEFTSDIGGEIIVFGSSKLRSVPSKELMKIAWKSAIEALREIGDCAKENKTYFCLEPLSEDQTNFINKVDEAVCLIDEVRSDNVKLILDVRSMCYENKAFSEMIEMGKSHLKHFHANDCNGYIPGTGTADYTQIMRSLKNILYDRYLSVEVFDFKPDPLTIAEKSINNLKNYLTSF